MTDQSVRVLHDGSWVRPGGGSRVAKELVKALDAPITVGHTEDPDWWLDDPDVDAEIAFNDALHDSLSAKVIDRPSLRPVAELRLGQLFDGLDPSEDIIVSSGTAAKWFVPRHDQHHAHYCHVPPPRFYARPSVNPVDWASKKAGAVLDQHHARFVDEFIANSEFTASRIEKHYGEKAAVVHPPVRTDRFQHQEPNPDPYFVMVGRLVEMKRARLVAEAFEELDSRLVMIGDGPLRRACEAIEGVTVYPDMSDWAVEQTIARSVGGIAFARREHCGITPKEFQAAGKPVIVPSEPNLMNHVENGETGVIVPPSREGVRSGVCRIRTGNWDPDRTADAAASWSVPAFHARVQAVIRNDEQPDVNATPAENSSPTTPAVPDGGLPDDDE